MSIPVPIDLSGLAGGAQIAITATSGAGNDVHATGTSADVIDQIWIQACNIGTAPILVTVEWGVVGAGAGSDAQKKIYMIDPQKGDFVLINGLWLRGTGAASRNVRVFAATASVINLSGYGFRYTLA